MLIIYPTETCYGLGCSAFNEKDIKRIYELKGRDPSKPLIVLVDSIKMWQSIAHVSEKAIELASKYWPGPLTIIQPKKKIIPNILAKEEVGVRCSPHLTPNKLIKELGAPLISTSANLSGGPNPYSIKEVPRKILDGVDRIIDEGRLNKNPPSTVIKIQNNKIIVLRKGSINI